MARAKKDDKAINSAKSASRPRAGRLVIAVALFVILAGAFAVALYFVRGVLLASPAYTNTAPRVSLGTSPAWLPKEISDLVTAKIQRAVDAQSIFENDLARRVYDEAVKSPWIAAVNGVTKRRDGRIILEADFRRPFVLVRRLRVDAGPLIVVDEDGVVLPLPLRAVRAGSFVTVDGVAGKPPAPGQVWEGLDLADGLRLMKLIRDARYLRDITVIDVRNHGGRINPADPHLIMVAQVGRGARTNIRFGRFPIDGQYYCVAPAQKLASLDVIAEANNGHLAGVGPYIELRYDRAYVGQR